ncbi:MAG: signal peptide peptidase SppA [Deltaproteobacteria bacterium]|nr:signal peptide peptidase SppA [Deltaproteobacteria bacterium]
MSSEPQGFARPSPDSRPVPEPGTDWSIPGLSQQQANGRQQGQAQQAQGQQQQFPRNGLGPPLRRYVAPAARDSGDGGPPKKTSYFSWPLVVVILGLMIVGSCTYTAVTAIESVAPGPSRSALSGPGVVVMDIEGEIFDTWWAVSSLESYEDDDNVKAVVMRINSPGGAVAPCQELYRAMRDFSKPIVVSMVSVAASGGLYLAMGGDYVFANPGTITGSIGVIMETVEVDEAMDKLGIKAQVIKSGEFKDIGSPFRVMRPEEHELLQGMISDVYEQFLKDVVAGRPKLTEDKIRPLADGRVFHGQKALELGFVDAIGGEREALDMAKIRAGLADDDKAQVVYKNGRASLLEELLGSKLGFIDKVNSNLNSGPTIKAVYRPGLF